jgi:hypothetical protein
VSLSGLTATRLWALGINTLSYQLQRDWFNLSPQAPPEIFGMTTTLVLAYILLRRSLTAEAAAASVLIAAPFVALLASILACAWVLARPVNAA